MVNEAMTLCDKCRSALVLARMRPGYDDSFAGKYCVFPGSVACAELHPLEIFTCRHESDEEMVQLIVRYDFLAYTDGKPGTEPKVEFLPDYKSHFATFASKLLIHGEPSSKTCSPVGWMRDVFLAAMLRGW